MGPSGARAAAPSEAAQDPWRPTRLGSLTGLRWLAALAVFFAHVDYLAPRLVTVTWVGGCGVALFFVLSGFVLAWSAPAADTARSFYRRRFARIYPLYLVSLAIALVVHELWGHGPGATLAVLVAVVLMVQGWFPGVVSVFYGVSTPAWSLSHEAFFYAVFPLNRRATMPSARGWLRVAAVAVAWPWVVAAGLVAAGRLQVADPWAEMLLRSPLGTLPCFILGIALARAMRLGWRPRTRPRTAVLAVLVSVALLTSSVAAFGALPAVQWYLLFPVTAPAFGLLIAALAAADLEGRPTGLRGRRMVALGEWSYAFYLVHLSVIDVVRGVFGTGWSPAGTVAAIALSLGLAVAASAALYHVVERPIERLLRGTPTERLSVPD